MPTCAVCRYRPGGAQERLRIRDVHLEYLMARLDLVKAGGALVDGEAVTGMFLLLDLDDPAQVDAFLAQEPYHRAGLFSASERLRLVQFVPEPSPGFLLGLLAESRRVAQGLRAEVARQ